MIKTIKVNNFKKFDNNMSLIFEVEYIDNNNIDNLVTRIRIDYDRLGKITEVQSLVSGYDMINYYIACGDAMKYAKNLEGTDVVKNLYKKCENITDKYDNIYDIVNNQLKENEDKKNIINKKIAELLEPTRELHLEFEKVQKSLSRCKNPKSIKERENKLFSIELKIKAINNDIKDKVKELEDERDVLYNEYKELREKSKEVYILKDREIKQQTIAF